MAAIFLGLNVLRGCPCPILWGWQEDTKIVSTAMCLATAGIYMSWAQAEYYVSLMACFYLAVKAQGDTRVPEGIYQAYTVAESMRTMLVGTGGWQGVQYIDF